MDYDPVPELKRKHFEEALRTARRSVAGQDLNKYIEFQRKFDPTYKAQQGQNANVGIDWGQGGNMDQEQGGDDDSDDDLYS